MLQAQHIIKSLAQPHSHSNCFHLSQLYTRGVPLALLSIAGVLLLKAMVLSPPKERRKHLRYSCGICLLTLLWLSHQWFWLLPGLTLYKLLPVLMKITHIYRPPLKLPGPNQDASQQEENDNPQARPPEEEGSTSLHYQYLSSYYSYDEQPQALYPRVLPPG